ncbi:uncharacterized protein LOC121138062 [Mesocricetus auratus]|uniref:Uncharacterized protein LOC121138062 n=1 Tax=Mesocricetus auratus TaxID=10036 RepID=A0ABM2X5P1_MESAU|nr:uncharacterized protein LOC121138062 [Mesocricetus auratus]
MGLQCLCLASGNKELGEAWVSSSCSCRRTWWGRNCLPSRCERGDQDGALVSEQILPLHPVPARPAGAMEDKERSRKIEYGRAIAAAWRLSRATDAMEEEERQRKIEYGRAIVEVWRLSQPSDAMEDKERRRKIEYARAKLAQYRQRIAQFDGQTTKKSKKVSICKEDEHSSNINEHADEVFKNVSQGVETNGNPDCTELILFPSGQANKHNQVLAETHASNSEPAAQSTEDEIASLVCATWVALEG